MPLLAGELQTQIKFSERNRCSSLCLKRDFSRNKCISNKYILLCLFQLSSAERDHRPSFVPFGANENSVMLILE